MVFMEELRSLKLKIGAPVPEPVLPALGEAKPPGVAGRSSENGRNSSLNAKG